MQHYVDAMQLFGIDFDEDAMRQRVEMYRESDMAGRRTATQIREWTTLAALEERRDSFPVPSQEYLICALYTMTPPVRSGDYVNMTWARSEENPAANECDLTAGVFVFRTFKTARAYGTTRLEIPPRLLDVLRKWHKKHPRETWVLCRDENQPMPVAELREKVPALLGCHVGTIRAIYATEHKKDPEAVRARDAVMMLHSFAVHEMYYVKTDI
jgi:hypothetical protein